MPTDTIKLLQTEENVTKLMRHLIEKDFARTD